jgi:hypothetical protein
MGWIARNRSCRRQSAVEPIDRDVMRAALQPGADCLDVDVLARYADAGLAPAERAAAAVHLEACVVCRTEQALLESFARGRIADDELKPLRALVREFRRREMRVAALPTPPRARSGRAPLFGWFRAALPLAVVLLAAAGGREFLTPKPLDLASRRALSAGASRSLTVELVMPRGEQPAVPRRLEWRPLAGAVRYRARLSEVDRQEMWAVETSATAVDLPEAVRTLIVPAKTLVWHVTAYDAGRAPIGESPPERFRFEHQ